MNLSICDDFSNDFVDNDTSLGIIIEQSRIEYAIQLHDEINKRRIKYPHAQLSIHDIDNDIIAGMKDENTRCDTLDRERTLDAGAVVFLDTDRQDSNCCLFLCIFLTLHARLVKTTCDWWEDLDFDDFKQCFEFPKDQRASDQDILKIAQALGIGIRRSEASDHVLVFGNINDGPTIDVQLFNGHYKLWIAYDDLRNRAEEVLNSKDFKRRCGW